LDLSRFCAAPDARLSHLPLESDRAFPAQSGVAASRIVEAVDVFEACRRVSHDLRQISSALMFLKNVSTAALS